MALLIPNMYYLEVENLRTFLKVYFIFLITIKKFKLNETNIFHQLSFFSL